MRVRESYEVLRLAIRQDELVLLVMVEVFVEVAIDTSLVVVLVSSGAGDPGPAGSAD